MAYPISKRTEFSLAVAAAKVDARIFGVSFIKLTYENNGEFRAERIHPSEVTVHDGDIAGSATTQSQ